MLQTATNQRHSEAKRPAQDGGLLPVPRAKGCRMAIDLPGLARLSVVARAKFRSGFPAERATGWFSGLLERGNVHRKALLSLTGSTLFCQYRLSSVACPREPRDSAIRAEVATEAGRSKRSRA